MASDALYLALAQAIAQPSKGYRALEAGLDIPMKALSGYQKVQEMKSAALESKLKPYEVYGKIAEQAGPDVANSIFQKAGIPVPDAMEGTPSTKYTPEQLLTKGPWGMKQLSGQKTLQDLEGNQPISVEQYDALNTGDPVKLKEAFRNGIPKSLVGTSIGAQGRNLTVVRDPSTGELIVVNKPTAQPTEIPGQGKGIFGELTPNQLKVIDDYTKAYSQDDLVQSLRPTIAGLDKIQNLLNSNNPASVEPLRSLMARSVAGEKGVLTDRDVLRQTGSQALAARFKRNAVKIATGNFSSTDIADFNQMLTGIRKISGTQLNSVTSNYARRAALRSGVPENRAREIIELGSDFGTSPEVISGDLQSMSDEELRKIAGGQP